MTDHFAKKDEIFVGGPCDGDVVRSCIPHTRNEVFRSSIPGDSTIYSYNGIYFHRYYRFMGCWRWDGLDSFDTLYDVSYTAVDQI